MRLVAAIVMSAVYKLLGCKGGKIPANMAFEGQPMELPRQDGTTVFARVTCKPSPERNDNLSRAIRANMGLNVCPHRLYVECQVCYTYVPMGRLHQHEGTAVCTAAAEKYKRTQAEVA